MDISFILYVKIFLIPDCTKHIFGKIQKYREVSNGQRQKLSFFHRKNLYIHITSIIIPEYLIIINILVAASQATVMLLCPF